ncbi:TIM-barrel domain-containing protein [Deinococcus sp. YIM 134068]|uniref:TIM-barrel domain-containing protein n=1 Tax=Deinococcus lichenicola TaxID=3118910 RepID=UPI002F920CE1
MRVTLGEGGPLPESRLLHLNEDGPAELTVSVQDSPYALQWAYQEQPFLEDHPERAYVWTRDGNIRHTRVQAPEDLTFGVGEVSGPLQKNGRRYTLTPRDALGYDPETGDPMYKHWPVIVTRRGEVWSALIYDQPQPMTIDCGCERHAYNGFYTFTEVQGDWLRYVVVAAATLPTLLTRLTTLLGRPDMPPRWSLGYLASSMAYTDAPDPVSALLGFAAEVRRRDVPCDGMHLSSGYSMHDGKRFVFEWNRQTVPDPEALIAGLHRQGIRTIANIKPALLLEHPKYATLQEQGAFLRDETGETQVAMFWGGDGSWLDFTNPVAREWWQTQVRTEVLERGIDGVWNDNNEFALDAPMFGVDGRPTFPSEQILGMATASAAAQREQSARTHLRPFLITRSASLGTQRLAQTWSGDNLTSWKNLRFNTSIGLGLGLSGYASNGHDVGGFVGDAPGAELLLRWIQHAVGYPRFSIHSWKNPPTEPWSHPEVEDAAREAIRLRYRLLPYLYSLFWEHTRTGAPIQRPLMYEFPDLMHDPGFDALLGPFLLFPQVGEGERQITRTLPGAWYDFHGGPCLSGTFTAPAPLERTPLLVREGAIVPVGPVMPSISAELDTERTLLLYPGQHSETTFTLYEDDGLTLAHQHGASTAIRFTFRCDDALELHSEVLHAGYRPRFDHIRVSLAVPDGRPLTFTGDLTASQAAPDPFILPFPTPKEDV